MLHDREKQNDCRCNQRQRIHRVVAGTHLLSDPLLFAQGRVFILPFQSMRRCRGSATSLIFNPLNEEGARTLAVICKDGWIS